MAHELEKVGDMVYVGEKPWHDMGNQVESIDEIPPILNYEVQTLPIYIQNGTYTQIPGHVAICRADDKRVYGLASEDYVPHQNQQLWDTFKRFCDSGNMKIETAGILRGGEVIWILAKLLSANSITVGKDWDRNDLFALIGSGHNNKLASFTKPTAVRVVCANTFNFALNDGKVMDRQVHRGEFDIKKAQSFVESAILGWETYHEKAIQLADKKVLVPSMSMAFSQELLQPENLDLAIKAATMGKFDIKSEKDQWVQAVFGNDQTQKIFDEFLYNKPPKHVKTLQEQIEVERGGDGDTWWHEFNGVTRYVDHVRSRTPDVRLYNAWFGSGAQIKQKAFDAALDYAEAA